MLAIERRNAILEKLQAERRVVVSELSQIYKVSEETIRRDLEKLENDGFVIKSYGGAVINENANDEVIVTVIATGFENQSEPLYHSFNSTR